MNREFKTMSPLCGCVFYSHIQSILDMVTVVELIPVNGPRQRKCNMRHMLENVCKKK